MHRIIQNMHKMVLLQMVTHKNLCGNELRLCSVKLLDYTRKTVEKVKRQNKNKNFLSASMR